MQGTGIQLGNIILATAAVVVALALCFSGSWELTFILFFVVPVIIISNRIALATNSGVQSAGEMSIANASHTVMETVDNIKTVMLLGAERHFVNIVKENLSLQLK